MKTLFIKDKEIVYDGKQIESLWAYKKFGLQGNSLVAFKGEANVSLTEMVDLEDVKKGEFIYSPMMLHFIMEIFDISLPTMVIIQRLFISIIKESFEFFGVSLFRDGDDLFYNNRKLSVSIATKNIVSCKIHTGLNIKTDNTPIVTSGIEEMNLVPDDLAEDILDRFSREYESIIMASMKVRGTF